MAIGRLSSVSLAKYIRVRVRERERERGFDSLDVESVRKFFQEHNLSDGASIQKVDRIKIKNSSDWGLIKLGSRDEIDQVLRNKSNLKDSAPLVFIQRDLSKIDRDIAR